MTTAQLFKKFSESINWNAYLYIFYKILYTSLSLLLLSSLSTQDFSAWANINSVIFLMLLWIDFGFRKSVPRYCPEFARSKKLHKRFVKSIILFQAIILIITVPLFFFLAKAIAAALCLKLKAFFFFLGGIIFFNEGIISIMRLIYHAHFWNKQFNLLNSLTSSIEMIANIVLIMHIKASTNLLSCIFITKIISGTIIVIASIAMLRLLYKDTTYPENEKVNTNTLRTDFFKHSGMMWLSNTIKSLTERNFLTPFFTYTLGQEVANLFKVANDGALLFHRAVLKTIGTTDTALLSHIEVSPGNKHLMPLAFKKLTTKVAAICLPLLGILVVIFLCGTIIHDPYVFQTFFILTSGYLLEALFSPYERVLEVKRRYLMLLIAYLPYIFMLCAAYYYHLITLFGLLGSIAVIQGVRLVSSILILIAARKKYSLRFPLRHIATLIIITGSICIFLYIALLQTPCDNPIRTVFKYIVNQ
jgi:hypothetical protein